MKRSRLGTLDVTSIGLGSAPLGGLFSPVSDADAHATLERGWSAGIRFYDTAPLYGFGLAERRLGAFLRQQPRDSYVISTKVGRLLRAPDGGAAEDDYYKSGQRERPVFDFSYDGVMRSVEESLGRLRLDRVDVLLVHDPDDHYDDAVAGAFRALQRLRSEGTVKAIGAGMNQSEMLVRFAEAVPVDCFLLAGRYTLLDQGALDALFPVCQARHIGILLGGIYNSGILANPHPGAKFDYQDADAALVTRALALDALCRKHGTELKAAALQFCMAHPAVTVAVMGARNAGEVADNIAMSETAVPPAFWQELRARNLVDARAPLPGGA
ncbi:putative oxidoreductase, aryl-alcohol dehydrogenase like protein [Bradyrhizobium sp. YR681]|uniref:aldo/keto reductase n=1 Tax=Bradyrhizobium sp. YR681 TaxID=1144344 RepID=UPI00027148F7|nr:aldo/keto reductase [Bradyrhizobium sp. YR681]EJN12709.1 putative oxidoreductase, aryl-alcohol dehydrogenase like protein [Bradyrhizobium sp. YR681]